MPKFSIFATALVVSIAQSSAFAPVSSNNVQQPSTQLRMMSNDDVTKTIGSSMVAASLFVSSIFTPEAAIAASDNFDFGASSSLIAAKSGGRAGGRSSASTMKSSPPPRPSQSTTTINRTTVIQAPAAPVVVAPPPVVVGGGFGYNPFMPSPLGKFLVYCQKLTRWSTLPYCYTQINNHL